MSLNLAFAKLMNFEFCFFEKKKKRIEPILHKTKNEQ